MVKYRISGLIDPKLINETIILLIHNGSCDSCLSFYFFYIKTV